MNIKLKFISLIASGVVILGIIITVVSATYLKHIGQNELSTLKTLLLEERKNMLGNLLSNAYTVITQNYEDAHNPQKLSDMYKKELSSAVDVAYSVIEHIYRSMPHLPEDERKKMAKDAVKNMRYRGTDYFWINDEHPTMIMHPFVPELDGKDLSDYKDPENKALFVEMVKVCKKNGEGLVHYMWPKPGHDKPVPKISYVRLFKPWGWIVGTGVYMEVAEDEIKQKVKEIVNSLRYGKDNKDYFYIFSIISKKMIQHPNPQLVGTDIDSDVYTDSTGRRLMVEQFNIAQKHGQGFLSYKWPKIGENQPVSKMTALKLFDKWNWVVCTGTYIDDMEQFLIAKDKEISTDINAQIRTLIFIVAGIGILIIVGVYLLINRSVIRPVRKAVQCLSSDAGQIAVVSGDILSISQSLNQGTVQQADSLKATVSALEQTDSASRQNADKAESARSMMGELVQISDKVSRQMNDMTSAINRISSSTEQIHHIIKTIEDIAFQTNLLALNAAVEAARAGEAGAGFSVVASEVRRLAAISGDAAKQTSDLIENNLQAVGNGDTIVRHVREAYTENIGVIEKISNLISEVSTASAEQEQSIAHIRSAMNLSDKITAENRLASETLFQASGDMNTRIEELKRVANDLEEVIGKRRAALTCEMTSLK